MSLSRRVLRIPLAGAPKNDDAHECLVYVQQTKSKAFNIEGTEGQAGYALTVGQASIHELRTKNYKGEPEEWKAALSWALLRQVLDEKYTTFVLGIETVATVEPSKALTINFRRSTSGILQPLGSLKLRYDPGLEIELFEWTGIAADTATAIEKQQLELESNLRARDQDLAKMRQQLEDLTSAKKNHEDELLEKFRNLLNSKKLKIRDQQRLLAGASADSTLGASIGNARGGSNAPARVAGKKGSKRKANDVVKVEESESSDGFEDVKKEAPGNQGVLNDSDDGVQGMQTPDTSEPETDDDDQPTRTPDTGLQSSESLNIQRKEEPNGAAAKSGDLPPPRDLPFVSRPQDDPSQVEGQSIEDEATDDEL